MRRIALWFAATVTVVVLLFGYHTSTDHQTGLTGGTVPVVPAGGTTGSSSSGRVHNSPTSPGSSSRAHRRHSSSGGPAGSKRSARKPRAKTYTGQTVQTARGPVEVRVRVRAGKIIKAEVPVHPGGDPRSAQINDYAVPVLVHETLSAQSNRIDMVSGATITSEGYVQSLQSALDKAGI